MIDSLSPDVSISQGIEIKPIVPTHSVERVKSEKRNPFENSRLVKRANERLAAGQKIKIAVLDIDSTLTGTPEEQIRVRKELERRGYSVVFASSRTSEMMMSRQKREDTPVENRRPPYKTKTQRGSNTIDEIREQEGIYKPGYPDEVKEMAGLYDPEAIIDGTGTNIFLEQEDGGYHKDEDFQDKLKATSEQWRHSVTSIVDRINQSIISEALEIGSYDFQIGQLAAIEDTKRYDENRIDVAPLDFRVQINFAGTNPQACIEQFKKKVQQLQLQKKIPQIWGQDVLTSDLNMENLFDLRITDDSKPEENRYQVYLTPNRGTKARATEELIKGLCTSINEGRDPNAQITRRDIDMLFCGDSFPDLAMGLYSALDTNATFLLAGGSRLAPLDAISGEFRIPEEFSDQNLVPIRNRLTMTGNGEYTFKPPGHKERKLIIGSQAYNQALGPQSILAYLEQEEPVVN
jgi:hydroxymethylpyrimidine pyrophosphatase-like HAD family hydrolase